MELVKKLDVITPCFSLLHTSVPASCVGKQRSNSPSHMPLSEWDDCENELARFRYSFATAVIIDRR
jgi:hypothetical protein